MTRRSEPTSLSDECHFDPSCPFSCPISTCVKEYPGGADGYRKDVSIKRLLHEGKTMDEVAIIIGLSKSQIEKRYNSGHFPKVNPTQALSVR